VSLEADVVDSFDGDFFLAAELDMCLRAGTTYSSARSKSNHFVRAGKKWRGFLSSPWLAGSPTLGSGPFLTLAAANDGWIVRKGLFFPLSGKTVWIPICENAPPDHVCVRAHVMLFSGVVSHHRGHLARGYSLLSSCYSLKSHPPPPPPPPSSWPSSSPRPTQNAQTGGFKTAKVGRKLHFCILDSFRES